MIVLGIETTCDETAAAVVERNAEGQGRILSNVVLSQIADHAAFGGVVPEIAARAHVEVLDLIINRAMGEAECGFHQVDGAAAAAGPGLIGGGIGGLTTAKASARAREDRQSAGSHPSRRWSTWWRTGCARACACSATLSARRRRWWRPAASPPTRRSARRCTGSRSRPAPCWWFRRRSCAPTTAP